VPARSQADVSEEVVTTRKQRRSARSRPDMERVEEREIPRRDTSGDGSRDFFGGLFGGDRD